MSDQDETEIEERIKEEWAFLLKLGDEIERDQLKYARIIAKLSSRSV